MLPLIIKNALSATSLILDSLIMDEESTNSLISFVDDLISQYTGLDASPYLTGLVLFMLVLFVSAISFLITKHVIIRILSHYIRHNRFKWDNFLLDHKVFHRMAHLIPAMIIYGSASLYGVYEVFVERIGFIYLIILVIGVFSASLDAIDGIYNQHDVARQKPIKGYLQGLKVFVYVIAGVIMISKLIGESPIILLSGIGAMTAVILLIFQDSILGLVAGIQLASNDMVRIGDWIEMPKYNADGDVIEISLTTVKVENFDRTITTIPPHALVKDSFRNWRGMQEAGGRRIMRSLYIDTSSISFCTPQMIDDYKHIGYLKDYIERKEAEIAAYNQSHQIDSSHPVNGRHMTNIGTFRAYIQQYIRNHTQIHQDMIQMVRQLPPKEYGLPIELYMFTKTTSWPEYETIQADIFDHILAAAPNFGLRVFQNPSGHDLRTLKEKAIS